MKKTILFSSAIYSLMILLSTGCDKEPETSIQSVNPKNLSFLETGRMKAAKIALSRPLNLTLPNRSLLLQKEIASLKKAGVNPDIIIESPNNVKSGETLNYNPWYAYRFYQVERYASNCYMDNIVYYSYNQYNCLVEEDEYSDYDQDGNYTYEGSFVYTYDHPDNAYTVRYVDHYNNAGNWDYYYNYYFGQTKDGYILYNITCIAKFDPNSNLISYSSFLYDNGYKTIRDYSNNNTLLYKQENTYILGGIGSTTVKDALGNFIYSKSFTYDNNNHYFIKKMSVGTPHTGAVYDYFYNTANADIVCYENKIGDFFSAAWVYRVDNTQTGYFNPLDADDHINLK